MFGPRTVLSTTSLLRSFSSLAVAYRCPSIRDITVESTEEFLRRQKEFRETVKQVRLRKQQQENAILEGTDWAYSLCAALGEEQHQEAVPKRGPLFSLIYGTDQGQRFDKDMARSFSQVLARGKYVHSIVMHDVKPDKVDEYVDLVGQWYPRMADIEENCVNLVGSWRTQVGDNDTFIHIWEYRGYEGYHFSLHNISEQPGFREFDRKLKSLIKSKKISLMQEFSFWTTTPPRRLGGLFELRSYTLHPGKLLEWETHWRQSLATRREVMEGAGAWFVQIGDLNTVHHLWQFANLEDRKIHREQSWGVEGWAETVYKTAHMIQTMQSRILVPMPWSPVG